MATAFRYEDAPSADITEPGAGATGRLDPAALGVTFPRVIRSEWVKFRSLRSNWFTLISTALLVIGTGAIAAVTYDASDRDFGDVATIGLSGTFLAQIIVGFIGVLAITSEFATGMIRSTFASVPKRSPILWAKAIVVAVATLAVALPTMFAATATGQAIIGGESAGLTNNGVLRAVVGSAGYLVAVALLGLGVGSILRNAASAIGTIFVLLLLAPELLGILLPESAQGRFLPYLPSNAGEAFTSTGRGTDLLAPATGALVLAVWVAGLLGIAAVLLKRRDA